MSAPKERDAPRTDPENVDGNGKQPVDSPLQEICDRITRTSHDNLTPLGMYSIHEGSPRVITLPTDADGFDDVSAVKQFCYEINDQELLIIAPVTV